MPVEKPGTIPLKPGFLNVAHMDVKLMPEPKAHLGIWVVEKPHRHLSMGIVSRGAGFSIDTGDRWFWLPEFYSTPGINAGLAIMWGSLFINLMWAGNRGAFEPSNLIKAQTVYEKRGLSYKSYLQKIWWMKGFGPGS